jgi:hypothetical protein
MNKPSKKDYDFNDEFQTLKFANEMIRYAQFLEDKIETLKPKVNFEATISDGHATYLYFLELPSNTCIKDVSEKLHSALGLKTNPGILVKK